MFLNPIFRMIVRAASPHYQGESTLCLHSQPTTDIPTVWGHKRGVTESLSGWAGGLEMVTEVVLSNVHFGIKGDEEIARTSTSTISLRVTNRAALSVLPPLQHCLVSTTL